MSACNFTQPVAPNLCLGDSLPIFNSNFRALDEGLCGIPAVIPGPGMHAAPSLNEHGKPGLVLSPTNSIRYGSSFSFKNGVNVNSYPFGEVTVSLNDFPFVSAPFSVPYATFSEILLEDNSSPTVSIFWTASGSDNLTVYATNSSVSLIDTDTGFNGAVNALLSSGNILYVGGDFTTVNGVDCKKICALNLNGGSNDFLLGRRGSLAGNPLSSLGDMGTFGTVNVIKEYKKLLIVGGSFQSMSKGRGLTILDRQTGLVYPFYVNGVVNDLFVDGDNLYVGGEFDYINYSSQGVSLQSGLRVYTNGLIKISLTMLTGYPVHSIDRKFAETVRNGNLKGFARFNTFAKKDDVMYVGGRFEVATPETLTSRYNSPPIQATSLSILSANGLFVTDEWNPIIGGEVNTITIDGDYMYVGGAFGSVHLPHQFFSTPRTDDASTRAFNAVCFNVVVPSDPTYEYIWKPRFNGPVTSFALHDTLYNSYIYCYGKFTKVNETDTSYTAAIKKSYLNSTTGDEDLTWRVNLQRGPDVVNQAFLATEQELLIGGNFTSVNSKIRKGLAKVNKIGEGLYTSSSLSAIAWDFGFNLCSRGTGLNFGLTTYTSTTSYPGIYGTINETTFRIDPRHFKGSTKGDLLHMFVRRQRLSNNELPKTAHVLGWKVDFN